MKSPAFEMTSFSIVPLERTATASTSSGCRLMSWALRTRAVSNWGPTTTAAWRVSRARSWLVSWSMSSSALWAEAKNSATARRCAAGSEPAFVKWSTK